MFIIFFFQGTQPGIEPEYPGMLYPDNVNSNIIGNVGHPIYDVNEVLFIYHTRLALHIYLIYKIYTIYI